MKHCVKESLAEKNKKIYQGFDNRNSKSVQEEYKTAIVYSIIALSIAFVLGLFFSGGLIKILQAQAPFTIKFINIAPDEILITSLKVAASFGIYLASPFILYRLIMPKVHQHKTLTKKFLIMIIAGGFLSFTFGLLFAYYALIPSILLILLGFNGDLATTSFSISKYVSFCLYLSLISAIAFEFPIFLIILALVWSSGYSLVPIRKYSEPSIRNLCP